MKLKEYKIVIKGTTYIVNNYNRKLAQENLEEFLRKEITDNLDSKCLNKNMMIFTYPDGINLTIERKN